MSKEFWDCFGIALPRSVIGPENSYRFLNQSDATLKPMNVRPMNSGWRGGGEGRVWLVLNTFNCVFLKIVTMCQNEQLSYARDFHLVIIKVGKCQLPSKDTNQG